MPWIVLLALAVAGCEARFPVERVPRMQWLVLPLSQPPALRDTPRAIQGWWLGARTIRQNPRAGEQVADILTRRLAAQGIVNLYSPIDLRYYFADKRQALTGAYGFLETAEVDRLIDEVPKVRFGQELGAERILTGRIIRLYMGENRTIHWWWSVAEVEFQVIDVGTGQAIWTKRYDERDQFASTSSVLERIAERVVEDLKEEVFRPMTQ